LTAAGVTVSVIIPTLNEERSIEGFLEHVRSLRPDEVIVVDGRSSDRTPEVASRFARLIEAAPSRGGQSNAGAAVADCEILLFLHADVRLDRHALESVRQAMRQAEVVGGCFDIRYDGDDLSAGAFSYFGRLRRRAGVVYGDSGIFCRRSTFHELGGYQPWPILEDYEFYRRLRKSGKLALLNTTIRASDRRWRESGMLRALWSWFWIQSLYLIGVSPHRLARMYRDVR